MSAEECSKSEAYDDTRYAIVVYIGTPIAVAGVSCNLLLLRMFCGRGQHSTPTLYLAVLAFLDLLLDLLYIPFFTVDALAIYNNFEILYHVWHKYAMILFGLSRLVQFASTYIILCATVERFLLVTEVKSLQFLTTSLGRYLTIIIALSFACVMRLPAFFEYVILYRPECPIYMSYDYMALLASWEHYQLFNFYAITVLQIFVPFALLLLLNISIVVVSKRKMRSIGWAVTTLIDMPRVTELIRKESMTCSKRRRDEVRNATWTMVSIATTYLLCSSLGLFVSIMENVFPNSSILFNEDGSSTRFYTLSSDCISILVAINSLLRIFVYMLCNPNFRADLWEQIRCLRAKETEAKLDSSFTSIGYENLKKAQMV